MTAGPETKHSKPGEAEPPTTNQRKPVPTTGERKMIMNQTERLMTLGDLSDMLGVPVATLYGWRHRGEGPPGYRIGRHVRYRREAVEEWLRDQADIRLAG